MDWSGCVNMMQGYLENSPLIVLGSGASMPYGLPSMGSLAEEIEKDPTIMADPQFDALKQAIADYGLETAIDSLRLQEETLECIRNVTWKTINRCDTEFFDKSSLTAPM